MTLPIETHLPLDEEDIESGDPERLSDYMEELVHQLESQYEDMVESINGSTQSFTPVLKDTASAATYTYTHQEGWYLRQGLMVDYWFDVQWSAIASGAPSGNLYVELPYKIFDAQHKPFVGTIQSSTLAYGAGLTYLIINAIPGTLRGEIWGSGDATATANLTANTASGQLIGHIRYVGIEFE